MEEFFATGVLPKGSNMTWVTLAPTMEGASMMKEFHPISMVGGVYTK